MEGAAIPSDQRRSVPRDPVGVRIIESPAQLPCLSRRRGWGRLRQGVALPGAASAPSPVPDASGWFTGTTPRFIQPGLVGRSRDLCMGQVTRSPPIRVPVSRPAIGMSRVVPYLFLRRIEIGEQQRRQLQPRLVDDMVMLGK